ncbi:LCP family protein [Paenibacillus sp. SC116]|uniref:LCP family protein n=1 Tax=Paenibacillus sp. SC116 TaxID=2968986 RepID=UPI00215AD8A9|nr:LCP family protein [Paenibacillus sp. SC116]MCR8845768.1 LCP family protein [Paenibacillus sp. SC116]
MKVNTPLPPRQSQQSKSRPNSSTKSNPRSRSKSTKKKMPTWLKAMLTGIILLVLTGIGLATYFVLYANNKLPTISTLEKGGVGNQVVVPTLAPQTEPFSFVLMGVDYRKELPGMRTDVVMVGAMHPETKEAVLVSLPRDTHFAIPGYGPDKLNHFYPNFHSLHKKGQLDSPTPMEEMKVMLGKYMDLDIDHAMEINFQGFVQVVDALGGVSMNVDQDMCYRDRADGTNIKLKAGQQDLSGQEALDLVRYRKSNCSPRTPETTDEDRNVRQNAVLQELVGNMQSLGGFSKVTDIIDALADNFKIDMTSTQIRDSFTTYIDINRNNIHYVSVGGDWKSPYIYINEEKLALAKQLLKDVMDGKSITPEQAAGENVANSSESTPSSAPSR